MPAQCWLTQIGSWRLWQRGEWAWGGGILEQGGEERVRRRHGGRGSQAGGDGTGELSSARSRTYESHNLTEKLFVAAQESSNSITGLLSLPGEGDEHRLLAALST